MVEGMISRFDQSFGALSSVIASGGLARLFSNEIKGVTAIEPDLTLTGLRLAYEAIAL